MAKKSPTKLDAPPGRVCPPCGAPLVSCGTLRYKQVVVRSHGAASYQERIDKATEYWQCPDCLAFFQFDSPPAGG